MNHEQTKCHPHIVYLCNERPARLCFLRDCKPHSLTFTEHQESCNTGVYSKIRLAEWGNHLVMAFLLPPTKNPDTPFERCPLRLLFAATPPINSSLPRLLPIWRLFEPFHIALAERAHEEGLRGVHTLASQNLSINSHGWVNATWSRC